MSQTIVVEAVSDKFANKYSNGCVKANGVWMQVAKSVDLDLFKKGTEITVETKTNDKGYTSIVGVDGVAIAEKPKRAKKEPITAHLNTDFRTKTSSTETRDNVYWQNKDESQKLGGLYHDAAQLTSSLILANQLTEDAAIETFERVVRRIVEIRG